jgi:LuxR family transcriptional regulator, regulator of acetate metabolism
VDAGLARASQHAQEASESLRLSLDDYTDLLLLLERTSILRSVVGRIPQVTGAPLGMIGQIEDAGVIIIRNWIGTLTDGLHDLVVPSGLGVGGKVLASRQPHWVGDYVAAGSITHEYDEPVRREQLHAMVSVPVVGEGQEVYGVLYAALRERGAWGDRAISSLQGLARGASTALRVSDRAAAKAAVDVESTKREVAFDLHDTVGALLFRIGAEVRDLGTEYDVNPALSGRLHLLEERVSEAASMLRDCLKELQETPAVYALPAIVRADCRAFEQRTGAQCHLAMLDELPPLDPARQDLVVRLVREGLLNVEKHADAGSVVVALSIAHGGLLVAVADDGTGPDPEKPSTQSCQLGLAAVRESMAQVGGTLELLPNDDRGTTLRGWIPWRQG